MDPEIRRALEETLTALADDELVTGHRDSEWCGKAPILEEDIAFANIALDEIGHAQVWYGEIARLRGDNLEISPDRLVYFRKPEDFRSAEIVELPNGDWAFSMLRQYLYDSAEMLRLEHLSGSSYAPVCEAAAPIKKEEIYHLRHTQAWVRRLGLGTEESRRRIQEALNTLWPFADQLLSPLPGQDILEQAGCLPNMQNIRLLWEEKVIPLLEECDLNIPSGPAVVQPRTAHRPEFKVLVMDMQAVARADLEALW
jgi:ring-1,2-phenylacetyl-CoA epoxidase subunit PaaC